MCKKRFSHDAAHLLLNNNFFSVFSILQFVCCSYDLALDNEMDVKCQDVHGYDSVWWDVPLGLGILMWLYFPLLLMKVSGKIHKEIFKASTANEEVDRSSVIVQVNGPVIIPNNAPYNNENNIVFNDGKSPITAFSMIKSSVSKLVPQKQKTKSRMAIFVYSILFLIIPEIEVLVHYIYLFDYIQSAAENNISFRFSSLLAGWEKSKDSKFSLFGGPVIALCLYLAVGWILMLSPKIMANQICFPIYAVFCLIEIIVGLQYYSSPMFCFFFCITFGFSLGINKYIPVKIVPRFSRLGLILRYPACLIVFLMLIYYLYIFTVLFIDSFFFVSRILLFTYTAIVAYLRETNSYFMLIFLTAYFGFRGFLQVGNFYKGMLKLTIKLCKQDEVLREFVVRNQQIDGNEIYGIPKEMFEFLVDHIRPRRVHIFHTAMHFVIIVFILSISIVLMERFEKFEDISLLVHVFITLFICAVPNIYNSIFSKDKMKQKLTRKIKNHLRDWILIHSKSSNDVNQN